MEFRNAARFFDKDAVYDGYTGTLLFYAHTSPHDDQSSSGATSRRRTMTTIPTVTAPARGVVTLYSERWLIGSNNPDNFNGSNVRRNFDLKKTTGLVTLYTPAQACLSGTNTTFYAHKEYYRDMTEARTSADMDVMWNIFCPPIELVVKGSFLQDANGVMRVRNVYSTIEGLRIAETDQFDTDARQTAVFTTNGTLNRVTDVMSTVSISTPCIQTDVPKFYQFRTQAEADLQPGDRTVFISKTALTPKVAATFTMMSKTWRVVAVVDEIDAWALLARLA